jgi:hypothetical protein
LKLTALPFIIVLVLMACRPAWSDEFKILPSLAVTEKYNDNIYLSTSDRQKDWITVLSPGLQLVERTERFDFKADGRLDYNNYQDLKDISALDQFYNGQARYSMTERLAMGAKAGYLRDSQPDRDLNVTGLALSAGRRENQNYGGSLDCRLLDTTAATLSYKYEAERYDRVYYTQDWWSHTASLDLVHDLESWGRGAKGILNFGYGYYDFQGNIIDNYTATIGFKHNFDEKWSVIVNAGGRFTHSEFSVYNGVDQITNGWGGVGNLVLGYQDNYTTADVTFRKDLLPASGYGGATDRTMATVNLRRRFTHEFQAFVTGSWYLNKSNPGVYSAQEIDQQTIIAGAGLRYEFNRDIYLEASYNYNKTQYRNYDTQADRNLFIVKFFIQHAFLE